MKTELEAKIAQWHTEASEAFSTYLATVFEGGDALAAYLHWQQCEGQVQQGYAFYERHFADQAAKGDSNA
ncbi:MAG: hypothetical protein HC911_18225 [Chloroflexaceae bacterium]|nr:hypothetical protein [Chloroflexaceae bacterium]